MSIRCTDARTAGPTWEDATAETPAQRALQEQGRDELAVDVGQAEVAALEAEG
jgi:hypothetical protein